jgi:hypothetical protein
MGTFSISSAEDLLTAFFALIAAFVTAVPIWMKKMQVLVFEPS